MKDIEKRYQRIFRQTPMVLWEQDFSRIYEAIDALRAEGVQDFRTYFTENPDVVVELAGKVQILDVNEHAVRVFRAKSAEELLTSIDKIADPESYPNFIEQLVAFAEGIDPFSCEAYVRTLDGERLRILFSIKMLHGPEHGLVTMVDISERKAMEEQLRLTNLELKRSNQELERFAYVASHDLQEPLRKICSFGSLLERRYGDQLDETALKYVSAMVSGAERMRSLINDLLTLSRTGATPRALQPVDSQALLDEVLSSMQVTIEESDARITHGRLPWIQADRTLIAQVLQNLIGNGIKFRRDETPQIHVDARRDGNKWEFSIADNGIGIDSKYVNDIFTIFKRLHGRGEYPGTGIGLAIVHKIIERHDGRIWVESEVGKGSTFHFTLPAADASQAADQAPES